MMMSIKRINKCESVFSNECRLGGFRVQIMRGSKKGRVCLRFVNRTTQLTAEYKWQFLSQLNCEFVYPQLGRDMFDFVLSDGSGKIEIIDSTRDQAGFVSPRYTQVTGIVNMSVIRAANDNILLMQVSAPDRQGGIDRIGITIQGSYKERERFYAILNHVIKTVKEEEKQ